MKRKLTPWLVACTLATVGTVAACSGDIDMPGEAATAIDGTGQVVESPSFFPVDDGARLLTGTTVAAKLRTLMLKVDPQKCLNISNQVITQAQYDEIKDTVDLYLAVPGDPKATYDRIFRWITTNVKFDYGQSGPVGSPDPYEVFKNKRCVCQGFANILRVMLHTQGIPCVGVNGFLKGPFDQGHAWCYAYLGNAWFVSDPTNGFQYPMTSVTSYENTLEPTSVDVPLFEENGFSYTFRDEALTLIGVEKCAQDYLTVPFSVSGFQVTSFCPLTPLPANVRTLYIGKNIQMLGNAFMGLLDNAPNVETVEVDADNRYMASEGGVVYRPRASKTPYYVPNGIRRVQLRAQTTIGKNVLVGLPRLEEVVISEGTQLVSAYAIEACPSLKRVYVPETAELDPDAIYNCGDDVEVVSVPTGIHDVTM